MRARDLLPAVHQQFSFLYHVQLIKYYISFRKKNKLTYAFLKTITQGHPFFSIGVCAYRKCSHNLPVLNEYLVTPRLRFNLIGYGTMLLRFNWLQLISLGWRIQMDREIKLLRHTVWLIRRIRTQQPTNYSLTRSDFSLSWGQSPKTLGKSNNLLAEDHIRTSKLNFISKLFRTNLVTETKSENVLFYRQNFYVVSTFALQMNN